MYFSIAAPQSVTLPDGTTLSFRVNAADTSQVEIHVSGSNYDGARGNWMIPMKRNGGFAGSPEFSAVAAPGTGVPNQARIDRMPEGQHRDELAGRQKAADGNIPLSGDPASPLADFKTVDDEAVRGNPRRMGDPSIPPGSRSPVDGGLGGVNTPFTGGNQGRVVLTENPARNPDGTPLNTTISPVHGRVSGVGMDNQPVKPAEGKLSDNPANPRPPGT